MRQKLFLLALLISFTTYNTYSQNRIGDPGRVFDSSKIAQPNNVEEFQAKRERWAKAGVVGGIRTTGSGWEEVSPYSNTNTDATALIQNAINNVFNESSGGVVKLKKGTYTVNGTIEMKKGVSLIGSGPWNNGGTKIRIGQTSGVLIQMKGINNSNSETTGLKNIRFVGIHGKPDAAEMSNAKESYNAVVIAIHNSRNSYLDRVHIINSGNNPVTVWGGFKTTYGHHSFRDLYINGCWNKGQGGNCYFSLMSRDCLVYNSTFKGLRHFAIQKKYAEFNVVVKNEIYNDVNFHDKDKGNNLIEKNLINIPEELGNLAKAKGRRYVVMGPWSTKHEKSENDNYIYDNQVSNLGFDGTERCKDRKRLYKGADKWEPLVLSKPHGNPFERSVWLGENKEIYATKSSANKALSTIKEGIDDFSVSIYPNLIRKGESFTIRYSKELEHKTSIKIINLQGKELFRKELSNKSDNVINYNFSTSGIYIVSISNKNGEKSNQKIVVN